MKRWVMNNKFIRLVIVFIVACSSAYGQTKVVIVKGRVTDKIGKAIPYAALQNANNGQGINTDARGFYVLKASLPITLKVFALGYMTTQKQLQTSAGDTAEINFELQPDIAQLQEVAITANHDADIIKEAPSLMDFELHKNNLWLVYSIKRKNIIQVLDSSGRLISQDILGYHVYKDSINHNPYNFLYSTYKDSIHLYDLKNDTIKIKSMPMYLYNKFAANLVAYRSPYYYYVRYDSTDTRVNYYYFNKATNQQKVFYRYRDPKLARSNRENKEVLLALEGMMPQESGSHGQAGTDNRQDTLVESIGYTPDPIMLKQLLLNIFQPQGASYQEVNDAIEQATQIVNDGGGAEPYMGDNEAGRLSMMISRPYTILCLVGDSVYIFNFSNNTLCVYSPTNDFVRQVPLEVNVHSINYRRKDILVDEQKHECYFKYVRWSHTYLGKIDLVTGKIAYTLELKYFPVDKVCIGGGYAYFYYSEGGQSGIYKQKLD